MIEFNSKLVLFYFLYKKTVLFGQGVVFEVVGKAFVVLFYKRKNLEDIKDIITEFIIASFYYIIINTNIQINYI